jgi:hypothetical protein
MYRYWIILPRNSKGTPIHYGSLTSPYASNSQIQNRIGYHPTRSLTNLQLALQIVADTHSLPPQLAIPIPILQIKKCLILKGIQSPNKQIFYDCPNQTICPSILTFRQLLSLANFPKMSEHWIAVHILMRKTNITTIFSKSENLCKEW